MSEFRLQKVESLLRDEIGQMIILNKIKDPRVSTLISITNVKISKDLAYAKIKVSGYLDDEKIRESVDALNHAAGFIQKQIGKKVKMRATPKLTFEADDAIKTGFDICRKIEDLGN